jgi:hypothetical protein
LNRHDGPLAVALNAIACCCRDGWVADVSAALTHCHAIAAARLAAVTAAATAATAAANAASSSEVGAGEADASSSGEAAGLRARADGLAAELAVLATRRQETRGHVAVRVLPSGRPPLFVAQPLPSLIYVCGPQVHEDVARSAAKHYQKLAHKLARADPPFLARFLDKGNLETLGAKLHTVMENS